MTSYNFYSIRYAYRFFTCQKTEPKTDSLYRCARLTAYRCTRLIISLFLKEQHQELHCDFWDINGLHLTMLLYFQDDTQFTLVPRCEDSPIASDVSCVVRVSRWSDQRLRALARDWTVWHRALAVSRRCTTYCVYSRRPRVVLPSSSPRSPDPFSG